MKHLDLTVFEPGDEVASISTDGRVTIFRVQPDGSLVSGNPQFLVGFKITDPIEVLDFTTRSYNVLMREGVKTIDALLAFSDRSDDELNEIRNLGTRCVDEIRTKVAELRGQGVSSQ